MPLFLGKMKIKAVLFDLDGTLIDSIGDIHYSVNLAIKEYGFDEVSYDFKRTRISAQYHIGLTNVYKDFDFKNRSLKITFGYKI